MTIAKGDPATRRSHVPNDGTAEAAAIERARKGMLHEGRDLKRTRIGADVPGPGLTSRRDWRWTSPARRVAMPSGPFLSSGV